MVSKVSATTDFTIPLVGRVFCCWSLLWIELMFSCTQIFGARYFGLPRCFYLLLLPLQLLLFVHSDPSFLCPVSCYSFTFCSFWIFVFFLFLLQLTSSSIYLTLSIQHKVQVSRASPSPCQIWALSLHDVWIRVILDTQTLHAKFHVSMDMADTQSSSDSGGNQRLSDFFSSSIHLAHNPEILSLWKRPKECIP